MAKSPNRLSMSRADDALQELGLMNFGSLEILRQDCLAGQEAWAGKRGILVGNAGRDMWRVFCGSGENRDGDPDPLNRWTRRVGGEICQKFGASALYPFGEPVWPFQRFAQRAIGIKPSPLGILIHPEFGMWHAFRMVLVFNQDIHSKNVFKELIQPIEEMNQRLDKMIHPCDACVDKPCLTACPVNAFSNDGLAVKACFSHIDSTKMPDCIALGCQARNACPVGTAYRYGDEQLQFHMKAYRGQQKFEA